MRTSVPLARRNLFADRRRLTVSVFGVGLAIMLILLLDGLWAGVQAQVTVLEDHFGADLYVVQPGTVNLFSDQSVVPMSVVEQVNATEGVRWAAPVRSLYAIFELHDRTAPATVIGAVPGEPGGPWRLVAGRAPRADDEIVLDRILPAGQHGLGVGSTVDLMGRTFRVVGLSGETTAFMTGIAFVTHDATDLLLKAPGTTSWIMVGTSDPAATRARLEAQGLAVLDRAQVRAADLSQATRIFGAPLRLMVGIAFIVGALIVALTAYTTAVERHREYGVLKAIGARGRLIVGLVVRQTMSLAALGLAAGGMLFWAGRALIGGWRSQYSIVLTPGSVGRAALAAVVMGLLAAVVPARRITALEPASVYRSGA